MVSKNVIVTAKHWTKICGLSRQIVMSTALHAIILNVLSGEWCQLPDKIMSQYLSINISSYTYICTWKHVYCDFYISKT
jgi:hypothetical protein